MKGLLHLVETYKTGNHFIRGDTERQRLTSAVATDLATGLTGRLHDADIDMENRLLEASRLAFAGTLWLPSCVKASSANGNRQTESDESSRTG